MRGHLKLVTFFPFGSFVSVALVSRSGEKMHLGEAVDETRDKALARKSGEAAVIL